METKIFIMENIQQEIEDAKAAGFSNEEIKNFYADEINSAKEAGFSEEEINKTYNVLDPDRNIFKDYIKKTINEYRSEEMFSPDDELLYQDQFQRGEPLDIKKTLVGKEFDGDYIAEQILGNNLWNLSKRAKEGEGTPKSFSMPRPEDLTWTEEFLTTLGTLGIESPIYALSALPGLPGGIIGSGFTGAAIPATTRATLLKVLENQDQNKPSDIAKILLEETLIEGTKEGLKFAGSMALPLLKVPGVGQLSKNYFSRTAAQILGYEGTGALIDQELPTKEEFATSAALFGLFNLRLPKKKAEEKMKQTYIITGQKPTDIALKSTSNRTVREDIISENIKVPRTFLKNENTKLPEKEVPTIEVKLAKEKFDDPVVQKAVEQIAFDKPPIQLSKEQIKEAAKKAKRKFVVEIVDQKYPVLEALRAAGVNTKTGIEKLNVYESLRLLEGMQGRSAHFIEYGTLDFKTLAETGPSLMSIIKPFVTSRKEQKILSGYLLNKHAIDLDARGKPNPIDIPNAKIFIKDYKNKKIKDPETGKDITYEQASQKINTYNNSVLKYAYDGGLITKESFDAFREINKNYVSMAAELPRPGKTGYTTGSSNPFKKLKGQTKYRIIDPLESIVKNTDFIIRATEQNKVKVDFINFVEKTQKTNPKVFDYIQKKKPNLKPIKFQRKELEAFLDEDDIKKLSDKAIEQVTIFRQEAVYPDATSISIRRNGKYEVYEVGEDLANAFRTMDNQSMKWYQKFLSAPTRTLRTGAIVTPDFALPNFFRDTINATFLSKIGWIPIADSMVGMFHVIYKDPKKATEAYKRFLKSGGGQSTLRALDKSLFDKDVHKILNQGIIRNEYKGVLGPFRYLTDISEEMTRVRMSEKVYKAGKKKGLTEKEALERAGFEARDLMDYAKKGNFGATVNRYSAFWNARVQGTTKLYETFRDRPQKAIATIFGIAVLPTIGFYISNLKDDGEGKLKGSLHDDYKELPEYIKQNKWYTKVLGRGIFIPKGYEISTFFSSLTEKILDYVRKEDEGNFLEFANNFLFENIKSYNPIPVWMKPHMENLMDYSFFRDAPIMPPNAPKNMMNQYYSTDYTNEAIKSLAEKLATITGPDNYFANPIYLENIYDSYTGGIGRMVKQSIEEIGIAGGVIDDPIRPKDPLTKIPGIRAFQAKDVYGYSSSINKYYKKVEDQKQLFSTLTYLKKVGNFEAYEKESKKVNYDIKAVIDIEDQMKDTSKNIRTIYNAKYKADGTLFTPEEKRELIDDLYKTRIGLAQKALKIMKELEQDNE